jgi:hypothetical protein
MTPENFCYWLQGWFELNRTVDHREGATPETLKMIEDHLKLVFDKKTPEVVFFDPNNHPPIFPKNNLGSDMVENMGGTIVTC